MKVYIAAFYSWEGTYIVGVFSTRELAEAAIAERKENFRNDDPSVEGYVIDFAS